MAILERVKTGLGITGAYQDGTLMLYIDEVKCFLIDAGVKSETVESNAAVGVITRGVADLWNYGAGEGKLSEYFLQRAAQLKIRDSIPTGETPAQELKTLTISSIAGSAVGYTKIGVNGGSGGAYVYKFTATLPNYGDTLTDWTAWDGVAEILANDNAYITVCEINSNGKAVAGGTTAVTVSFGD